MIRQKRGIKKFKAFTKVALAGHPRGQKEQKSLKVTDSGGL